MDSILYIVLPLAIATALLITCCVICLCRTERTPSNSKGLPVYYQVPTEEQGPVTQYDVVDEFQHNWKPSAKSDYPSFFLSLESETSLPENAERHHIFTGSSTHDLIMCGALSISENRAYNISENTVFCAPKKWHAWETANGPRIVSSERVVTVQCERRGIHFVGTMVGKRYAIFRNDGHLMAHESLGKY